MNHHVYVAGAPTLVGALTRRPGPRLWWPLDAAFGVCRGRQQRHQAAQRYLCPGAPAGTAGLLRRRTMNEDRPPSCQQCAALRAELDKVRRERDALRGRRAAGALFRAMLERADSASKSGNLAVGCSEESRTRRRSQHRGSRPTGARATSIRNAGRAGETDQAKGLSTP